MNKFFLIFFLNLVFLITLVFQRALNAILVCAIGDPNCYVKTVESVKISLQTEKQVVWLTSALVKHLVLFVSSAFSILQLKKFVPSFLISKIFTLFCPSTKTLTVPSGKF